MLGLAYFPLSSGLIPYESIMPYLVSTPYRSYVLYKIINNLMPQFFIVALVFALIYCIWALINKCRVCLVQFIGEVLICILCIALIPAY